MSASAQVQITFHLQALAQPRLKMRQKSKQKRIVFQPKKHGVTTVYSSNCELK